MGCRGLCVFVGYLLERKIYFFRSCPFGVFSSASTWGHKIFSIIFKILWQWKLGGCIYRIENAEFVLRKYIPSIGRQRESLKSATFRRNSKIVFILLLFVTYFFAIWPTYFCWIYKLFSYPLTIRCLLFSCKITLKIESLQIVYLILLPISWELFWQKLT